MTYIFEAKGYSVIGHEVDYFKSIEPSEVIGMSTLISRTVGDKPLGEGIDDSFTELSIADLRPGFSGYFSENQKQDIKQYKEETGMDYPKLYKVKITCEAEPLSEEEIKTYWETQQNLRKEAWELYSKNKANSEII